jgi:hypothetical protein
VIPLSGFSPKADLTHVPPAVNAYNLELDKTAVENTFFCKQRDPKGLVNVSRSVFFCVCKQTRKNCEGECEIPIITMQCTEIPAAVTESNEFGRGGLGSYKSGNIGIRFVLSTRVY